MEGLSGRSMKRPPLPQFSLLALFAIFFALATSPALAHKVSAVSVVADFDTKTRQFKVELAMDVDPSGDPTIDDQIPPEEAARTFATEALTIYFDDESVSPEPSIRVVTASDEDTPAELERKKVIGTLKGSYAEDAENFLLHVNETTEAAVVMVSVKDGKPARRLQVLYPGEFSNPVGLAPVMEGDPFDEKEKAENPAPEAEPKAPSEEPAKAEETASEAEVENPGIAHWLGKGFLAIFPVGLEYWAFMLAMFLLSLRAKPLGWQVGLYTVAHSITLALGSFQLVNLSPNLVLAIVAASALYPAIENLFVNELKPWRGVAIFVLGLFHGLALSDVLMAAGPRVSGLLPALIGFNLGVELAQLAVLVIASIVAVLLSGKPWFRHRVVMPLCVIVAGISLFRLIEVLGWI